MVTPAAWVPAVCHACVTCSACSHHSWLRTLLAAETGTAFSAMHATARPTAAPACARRGNPSDTAALLETSTPGHCVMFTGIWWLVRQGACPPVARHSSHTRHTRRPAAAGRRAQSGNGRGRKPDVGAGREAELLRSVAGV